jgi:hypothetical protein
MQIIVRYLERNMSDGVCVTSHWTAIKKDGDFSALKCGQSKLPAKDPSDPTFVAYDAITETQAIEWTAAAIGEEKLAEMEAKLDAEIAAKQAPAQAAGVPWGAEVVSE